MNHVIPDMNKPFKNPDAALAEALSGRGFGPGGKGAPPAPPKPQPPGPRTIRDGEIELGKAGNGDAVGLDLAKLIEGRLLIQGNSGAGKSMLLRRLFEQAFGRVQQLVVDADGEFATLAEIFDVAVLPAVEVQRIGGRAFAHHLREHRYSAVLDLSDATAEQRLSLVADLAEGLIDAPQAHWHPILVLVDEAQTLAPYYDTGDIKIETRKRVIATLADLMGRGRKRGLAGIIATQRLAETAKAVVSKATNIVVGRTVFDRDLERAGALLGFTVGHSRTIRGLADGEFIALGPALGPHRLRFKAGPVRSRHKGTAPKVEAPPKVSAVESLAMLRQVPAAESSITQRGAAHGAAPPVRASWTAAEDTIIRDCSTRGLNLPQIIAALEAAGHRPRSLSAISTRRQMLGCTSNKRAVWTPAEDQIVRDGYNTGKRLVDIMADLTVAGFDRPRNAIQMRAISLGISGDRVNYWTEAEKAIAIAGLDAGKRHADILADLRAAGYHRGTTAINRFAKLHNRARPHENPWTDEHLAILRECYESGAGPKEAVRRLGRPYSSIVGKASAIGISVNREFTNVERQTMIDMHAKGARLIDIATALKRPYANVSKITSKMGLRWQERKNPAPTKTPKGNHKKQKRQGRARL